MPAQAVIDRGKWFVMLGAAALRLTAEGAVPWNFTSSTIRSFKWNAEKLRPKKAAVRVIVTFLLRYERKYWSDSLELNVNRATPINFDVFYSSMMDGRRMTGTYVVLCTRLLIETPRFVYKIYLGILKFWCSTKCFGTISYHV